VQKAHVRSDLNWSGDAASVNVHGGGVVAHSIHIIEMGPPALAQAPAAFGRYPGKGSGNATTARPLALQQ
jgi:hypothetical protein